MVQVQTVRASVSILSNTFESEGFGDFLPFVEQTARSFATTFSFLAPRSTIPKAGTSWNGTKAGNEGAKRLGLLKTSSKPHAAKRSKWRPSEGRNHSSAGGTTATTAVASDRSSH